ncbi:hypothetical protein HKD37_05G012918 [Glycine soja]
MELIENMTASDHAILCDRTHIPTKRSLLELSSQDALLAQNNLLAKQLESLTETLSKLPTQLQVAQQSHSAVIHVGGCNICGGAHESGCCIAQDEATKEHPSDHNACFKVEKVNHEVAMVARAMMASKKRHASTSRPQKPYDTSKFVSEELERRQWHRALTRQPDNHIDLALVKEFYANLYDPEDRSPSQCKVRGKLIKFDAMTLNAFLETLVVLEPGERARLVYGLIMKMDMDVGSIISGQISQMAQPNSSRLGFPALITALCIARGVVYDSLTFESLSPTINLAYIRKNCWNPDDPTITFPGSRKAKARAPSYASTSVPASTPAPPTPVSAPAGLSMQSTDAFVSMLQSLHPGLFLVAWPRVQPSFLGGGETPAAQEPQAQDMPKAGEAEETDRGRTRIK